MRGMRRLLPLGVLLAGAAAAAVRAHELRAAQGAAVQASCSGKSRAQCLAADRCDFLAAFCFFFLLSAASSDEAMPPEDGSMTTPAASKKKIGRGQK